jgi:hypothetical protein
MPEEIVIAPPLVPTFRSVTAGASRDGGGGSAEVDVSGPLLPASKSITLTIPQERARRRLAFFLISVFAIEVILSFIVLWILYSRFRPVSVVSHPKPVPVLPTPEDPDDV